jgi:hypothetical protein
MRKFGLTLSDILTSVGNRIITKIFKNAFPTSQESLPTYNIQTFREMIVIFLLVSYEIRMNKYTVCLHQS